MVSARDDDGVVKVQLASRFQEAIDEAAMQCGAIESDAYLEGWRRSEWIEANDNPTATAEQIAANIETTYDDERLNALIATNGE